MDEIAQESDRYQVVPNPESSDNVYYRKCRFTFNAGLAE
jgi:hypothetical protein